MTREETADVLEAVVAVYPYAKIVNAAAMVEAWQLALGEFNAEAVKKAALLHIATCQSFPTPAAIRKKIVRAELVYNNTETVPYYSLEPVTTKEVLPDGWLEAFCEWIGFGCEEDDSALNRYYEANPAALEQVKKIMQANSELG